MSAPLYSLSTPIILHTIAAVTALLSGIWIFGQRRGTPRHKLTGRIWVGLMLVTAVSSFWIRSTGHFSWIHGLSLFVLLAIPLAVYHARQRNVQAHRGWMIGLFSAGLVGAGVFTLLPGRLIGHQLWLVLGMI